MSLNLNGKVAIVTGASKGIGAGIAKKLASLGAAVTVNYASSKEDADKVVAEITAGGGRAIAVKGNVASAGDVKDIFAETKKAFGKLDIVVNNAGIFKFEPLEQVTETEFHAEFNINVLGPILTAQESLNYFSKEGGSIINISSVSSTSPSANSSVYSSTKGAIDTLTKALAVELAPRNIRVNAVAPGPVETEGFERLGIKGSDFEKSMIASTPLGRIGQPVDIANAVAFLASEASAWLTGERLSASGGLK
jgi:3-oxoacyl-[acyl-carrier protein] reductase